MFFIEPAYACAPGFTQLPVACCLLPVACCLCSLSTLKTLRSKDPVNLDELSRTESRLILFQLDPFPPTQSLSPLRGCLSHWNVTYVSWRCCHPELSQRYKEIKYSSIVNIYSNPSMWSQTYQIDKLDGSLHICLTTQTSFVNSFAKSGRIREMFSERCSTRRTQF